MTHAKFALLDTSLGQLFVESRGQGPAVVALWHCFLGDSAIWQAQAQALEDGGWRVILIDGPAHGRSATIRRRFTLEDCADAWIEALDQLGVKQPAVFGGLSWGGMVALRVALRHPDRVRALALFDTIATPPKPSKLPPFVALAAALRLVGAARVLNGVLVPQMVSRRTLRQRPRLASEMLARNKGRDRTGLFQVARALHLHATDISAAIRRIEAPALVVVGREDRTTPLVCSKRIAAAIAGSRLEIIDHVGHLSVLEAPAETSALLTGFVDSLKE